MTVTSFYFFLLLAVGVLLYYLLPHRIQWIVLTVLSVVFYFAAATPYTMLFLLAATLITYGSTLYISARRTEDGTAPKLVSAVAVSAIFLNTLLWFLLKGSSFWILGSGLIHRAVPAFPILPALPWVGALGMGYYTAQVIGYILDVLWGTAPVQRNPLKLFLFVSFFPQLTVGPISRYQDFSKVYEPHAFSYENICFGTQRILWGLFKKLVIADRVGVIISSIWAESTAGLWPWIAVFLYPLQIYTDFSGCMDIVLGAAELFDIHLAENFKNLFQNLSGILAALAYHPWRLGKRLCVLSVYEEPLAGFLQPQDKEEIRQAVGQVSALVRGQCGAVVRHGLLARLRSAYFRREPLVLDGAFFQRAFSAALPEDHNQT